MHYLLIHGAGVDGSATLLADIRRHLPDGDTIDAPDMPHADDPQAARWLPAIGQAMGDQTNDFIAIGHSLGASSLLQWLGANPPPPHLNALICIAAPFWGADDLNVAQFAVPANAATRLSALPITLLQGDSDEVVPADHLKRYADLLPNAKTAIIPGMDHEWAKGGEVVIKAARSAQKT